MAFDVYVGSFTRFYRNEWENVAQKMAREQGWKYNIIHAGGTPPPPPPALDIQKAVQSWCAAMQQGLGSNVSHKIEWDESERSPYFTDRPGWEVYRGLILLAAYEDHPDLTPPAELPEEWISDEAFKRSTAKGFRSKYSQILNPQLWLPLDADFYFEGGTLTDEKQKIGATFGLKRQLDRLRESTAEKLAQVTPPAVGKKYTINFAGKTGLEMFLKLATLACKHRLPILLSF